MKKKKAIWITARIDEETRNKLREFAQADKRSVSQIIGLAVEKYLGAA